MPYGWVLIARRGIELRLVVDTVDNADTLLVDSVDGGAMGVAKNLQRQTNFLTQAQELSSTQYRVVEVFIEELLLRDPAGSRFKSVSDPDRLGRETADAVLNSAQAWRDHLGPLYDTEGVGKLLARGGKPLSRQAVNKRKGLLALTTGSGRIVYPAFQFRGGSVISGLDQVLEAIPRDLVSRWTVASWLISPENDLDGTTPLAVLSEGGVKRVVSIAQAWTRALRV